MKISTLKAKIKREFYLAVQNKYSSVRTLFCYQGLDGYDAIASKERVLDAGDGFIDQWDVRAMQKLLDIFPNATKKKFTRIEYTESGWEIF